MFTEKEIAYIRSQPLGRIATVDGDGQPDNVAIGFQFDGKIFHIGGLDNPSTRKYKNVANGYTKVALLIDDLQSVNPWRPRGIRIYGTAEIIDQSGRPVLKITPVTSWSWDVEEPAFKNGKFSPHKTSHSVG